MSGLGFGLISCQTVAGDERGWEDRYAEALDLVVELERLGFRSAWTTEHHFVDDGYMPSLLVTSAAMAARTERILIGTGVVLAPLHHPLRLAEDAATVALISRNRLLLGLGLGWSEIEFDAFGADLHRRGAAMDEVLSILSSAWSGQPFHHRGTVYEFPQVAIRPVPTAPVPVYIGASAEAGVRRAARLADGFFSNAPLDIFLEQVRVGREEMERVGRDPASFRWSWYSSLFVSDNSERGLEELVPHLHAMTWKYQDMGESANRPGGPTVPPPLDPAQAERLGRRALIGTGEQIVQRLGELEDAAGVPIDFVARSYFPTMSREQQLDVIGRLASYVLPDL